MEEDREVLKELEEEAHGDVEPLPPTPPRKKGPSRIYFGVVAVGMSIFLLLCVIALGSFGAKQAQLPGFFKTRPNPNQKSDIKVIYDYNQSDSPCVFIFWGLTSGTILALVMLIYSLVMLIIGSRILNWPRLVDCILCFFGFVGFFAFSITLTAGLNRTCAGFTAAGATCSVSYFLNISRAKLYFYTAAATAKNCSWIITFALLIFSIWNLVLVIIYFRQRLKSRRQLASNEGSGFTSGTFLSSPVEQPPPYSKE